MLLFIVLGWVYLSTGFSNSSSSHAQKPPTKLELAGARCADIAERSVANIVPIIEFQRLERSSRQAHVLGRCMRDQGFSENAAWLAYALPIASVNATHAHISAAAALEDMRRLAMRRFNTTPTQPMYWQAKK